jgi:sarcosine oxidase, subunit beta
MSVTTCDVLIIGAGIAGITLAEQLARANVKVIVLEALDLARGSSGQNAGGVRQQFSEATNIRAGIDTLSRIAGFFDETAIDVGFRKVGYLFLAATAKQEATLEQAVALQNSFGIRSNMVTPQDIRTILPEMNVSDIRAGSFCGDDGYVDPKKLVKAFATLARSHGAKIFERTPVTDISISGSRIVEVVAGEQRFTAATVVNAAGVWAPRIARIVGADLPITSRRSNLWVAKPEQINPGEWIPQVIDLETRVFYHSEIGGDGSIVFGVGGAELVPDDPDIPCNWDKLPNGLKRLGHRMPRFVDAVVTRGWAGLVEATPDDNPIVGWTFLENLYTNAGYSGHGMGVAPGIAIQIARELQGLKPDYSLDSFRHERFENGVVPGEDLFGVSVNAEAAGI